MSAASAPAFAVSLVLAAIGLCACAANPAAAAVAASRPRADAPGAPRKAGAGSPSQDEALVSPLPAQTDEAAGSASQPDADPLVANGLGSPSCRSGFDAEMAA